MGPPALILPPLWMISPLLRAELIRAHVERLKEKR